MSQTVTSNNNNSSNDSRQKLQKLSLAPEQKEEDSFDVFVKMRAGLGNEKGSSDIVYWTGEGELYESPSGKLIAKVDGVEVSKGIYYVDDNINSNNGIDDKTGHVRVFSRKIFWFRDKDTNEIITQYNGRPVSPIRYDWQVFDFQRGSILPNKENSRWYVNILPTVVKSKRNPPDIMPITARTAGAPNQYWFQAPIFIDLEIPGGTYQAWEFYDYCMDSTFPTNRPPSMSWTRNGYVPPFILPPTKNDNKDNNNKNDNHTGVMHFHSYRVDSFDELPTQIQNMIENEYSLFRYPPYDMEEIERLIQKENDMNSKKKKRTSL